MTEPATPSDRPDPHGTAPAVPTPEVPDPEVPDPEGATTEGATTEDAAPQRSSGPSSARGDATIRLDDFLKRRAAVGTGGEAKIRIQGGEVRVNGETETRRRRQLVAGDRVEVHEIDLVVEASETHGRV